MRPTSRMSTSPNPTGDEPPRTPDQIARDEAYEAWFKQDIRRRGVMARHAWDAAWKAAKEHQ